MNREIIIDKNMKELNPQGTFRFPFNSMDIVLSHYPFCSFPCHWHPEIELYYVLEGEMTIIAGKKSVHIKERDLLFVNANVLHAGEQFESSDCRYICIVFSPVLISSFEHSIFNTTYVAPILENQNFWYAHFTPDHVNHNAICHVMKHLSDLDTHRKPGYELHIESCIYEFWAILFEEYTRFLSIYTENEINPTATKQLDRLKKALVFIYDNYTHNITLDEMANSCHISKSEFCRLFKRTLHQTPFDFLQQYRIEKSLPLLCSEDMRITDVAINVGFSGPSYYSEIFRKYMKCSPTKYRQENMRNPSAD